MIKKLTTMAIVQRRRRYVHKAKSKFTTKKGKKFFRKAIRQTRGYLHCCNVIRRIHFYDPDRYMYYNWAKEHLDKAYDLFCKADECGHDMALLHKAFIKLEQCPNLYHDSDPSKHIPTVDEAVELLTLAYKKGFPIAAYELAAIYKNGFGHIIPSQEKFEFYATEHNRLKETEKRKKILSADVIYTDEYDKKMDHVFYYNFLKGNY